MKEKLSREVWTIIVFIVLVNLISFVSSGFLSHPVPVWSRILTSCMLFIAAIFVVLEIKRQMRR
jgi:membrane protein YdbS with pleckstrin-like domain